MNESSLKDYGFEYQFDGKLFSFSVTAFSKEDAEKHVIAMTGAHFVGEIKEDD